MLLLLCFSVASMGVGWSIGNTKPLFTRAHPPEPPSTPPATTPRHTLLRAAPGGGAARPFILPICRSKEMVDLTMALFAKFWVNGNQDELLSLLG